MKIWWDTFEDNNTNGWTFVQNGVVFSVDATTAYGGTHSLKLAGNAANGQWGSATSRTIPLDLTSDYTVQFGFKWSAFNKAKFLNFGHIRLMLDLPASPMLYDPSGAGDYSGHQVSSTAVNTYLVQNVWELVTVKVRPSQSKYWIFVNGTLIGTVVYQPALVPTNFVYFEDSSPNTYVLSAWYDEFAVWGMQNPTTVTWIHPGAAADPENTVNWAQPANVPYHCQYQFPDIGLAALSEANSPWRASGDNHRCLVASLAMVFHHFDWNFPLANLNPNGQEEIAAASNTNDRDSWGAQLWTGTYLNDGRRGAQFSILTQALTVARATVPPPPAGKPNPRGAWGYTWRDLGYSAVDSTWVKVARQDSLDFAGGGVPKMLEELLASGYPLMVCFNPPADWYSRLSADLGEGEKDTLSQATPDSTAEGHCVVLVGYDNLGGQGGNPFPAATPAVLLHDPGRGKYLWCTQQYFFGQVWKFGRFLFAAPWELQWLSISTVAQNVKFDGSALVTYTGPKPVNGCYAVTSKAQLAMNGIGLQAGEAALHNLANIALTGDWDCTTYKLQAPGGLVWGGAWVKCTGYGTMTSTASKSYKTYADKLGTRITQAFNVLVAPPFKPIDLGHAGWPYGDDWWRAGTGGSGLQMAPLGGSTCDLSGLVENEGLNPTPPSLMTFYWRDPTVTEKAPGLNTLGTAPIPPLTPGDTLRVHSLCTLPPENTFGESFFDIFGEILCSGDPPASQWPQEENNYGALADYAFELADPELPAAMWFRVQNPETGLMNLALVVQCEEAAEHWQVALTDSLGAPLPVDVPVPIPPGGSYRARVTVTPVGDDSIGHVHVQGWLYTPGLVFVRETGGITLSVKWRAPVAGVGPDGPAVLSLAQARPNPFTRATAIRYSIARAARVRLRVYDVAGRLVATLAEGPQAAGPHSVVWDGAGAGGRTQAGVFFCRLEVEGAGSLTRRIVHLR